MIQTWNLKRWNILKLIKNMQKIIKKLTWILRGEIPRRKKLINLAFVNNKNIIN